MVEFEPSNQKALSLMTKFSMTKISETEKRITYLLEI